MRLVKWNFGNSDESTAVDWQRDDYFVFAPSPTKGLYFVRFPTTDAERPTTAKGRSGQSQQDCDVIANDRRLLTALGQLGRGLHCRPDLLGVNFLVANSLVGLIEP